MRVTLDVSTCLHKAIFAPQIFFFVFFARDLVDKFEVAITFIILYDIRIGYRDMFFKTPANFEKRYD